MKYDNLAICFCMSLHVFYKSTSLTFDVGFVDKTLSGFMIFIQNKSCISHACLGSIESLYSDNNSKPVFSSNNDSC